MSYKSRQKKRAIKKAQMDYRDVIASRHYLTIVTRSCSCNACGGSLRLDREAVYRHTPREILCLPCARSRGVSWRPSLRWEKRRQSQRKAGGGPGSR